jgi:phytoene synthase
LKTMADTETLDDLVRRVDPDRWLASRWRGPT